ncbi:MAG: Unknown protein [uncultured Sulfurovum sp.]|uniref:Lipoprotein n=1 Tax=uncultured Sulfurovum sp. TaxID=269237 RepID=A0A6S6TKV0_9BACT|nr:MAG: Unknown protein [uncultured Sulfurovum sp.]
MQTVRKTSILFSSILIFLLLQGCGSNDTSHNYATTLGEGISIGTTDEGAVMAANTNTLKNIAQEIGSMIKSNVSKHNQQEAIDFNKETNYCDISGLKVSKNSGTMEKITHNQSYDNCQEAGNQHHGKLNINYRGMDDEGKYPKYLNLEISEDYTFNNTKLKKNLSVESQIVYRINNEIQEIQVKINGELNFNNVNYGLQNIIQTLKY